MTDSKPPENTAVVSGDRSSEDRSWLSRRGVLASSAALGAMTFGGVETATAEETHDDDDTDGDASNGEVDEPEGFSVEVVAPAANFPDDVSAMIGIEFEDDGEEFALVEDASNMIIAKATWEPDGETGWHTHPGPVFVSVVEGEIEITYDDCDTHTYSEGEAFVDPGGHAENATNPSDEDEAVVYAIFLSVPDGEAPTTWVEPPDC